MYLIDLLAIVFFFFCKQKTPYEMRISDWSSDVCSSDLHRPWYREQDRGGVGRRAGPCAGKLTRRRQRPRNRAAGTAHRDSLEDKRQAMSQTPPERDDSDAWLPEVQPDGYGISAEQERAVSEALAGRNDAEARQLTAELHAADLADLLENLDREERGQLVRVLGPDFDLEVLTYLDVSVREEIVEALEPQHIALSLADLDSDDAVDIFEDLDEEAQQRILAALQIGR